MKMSIISRDQMPPRSTYEAERRKQTQELAEAGERWEALALAQNTVVKAATDVASCKDFARREILLNVLRDTLSDLEAQTRRIFGDRT